MDKIRNVTVMGKTIGEVINAIPTLSSKDYAYFMLEPRATGRVF